MALIPLAAGCALDVDVDGARAGCVFVACVFVVCYEYLWVQATIAPPQTRRASLLW